MKVLVTGGCGYIGSHTCLALQTAGMEPVVVDNLCNSKVGVLARIAAISGRAPLFYQGDIRDPALLDRIFAEQQIAAVIHFAALKAVGESTRLPLEYYENNLGGTLTLLQAMKRAGVHNLVFSSSATVYGEPTRTPIAEDFGTGKPAVTGVSLKIREGGFLALQNGAEHVSFGGQRHIGLIIARAHAIVVDHDRALTRNHELGHPVKTARKPRRQCRNRRINYLAHRYLLRDHVPLVFCRSCATFAL